MDERDLEFNATWLRNYTNQVKALIHYEDLLEDSSLSNAERAFVVIEVEERQKDIDEFKKLVQTFDGLLPQLLYKKYIEGQTIEMVANEMHLSRSYCTKLHSEFTKYLKGQCVV